jgi:hypothetical protein
MPADAVTFTASVSTMNVVEQIRSSSIVANASASGMSVFGSMMMNFVTAFGIRISTVDHEGRDQPMQLGQ